MKITRERTRLFARLMASGAACAALLGFASHAQAQTTLRVWTRSNPDARTTYDNIAAAFTKKTGIKVEYFNAMTDYEQRLSRAIAGNDLPDVIINDSSSLGLMMKTGVATEIDRAGFPGGADIQDRAWQGAQGYNGKYYAVPVSVQSFVFFIRKDWREKLGLPQPKSWDDMAKLAKAFTTMQPAGAGKPVYGFTFPASATRGYTTWFMSSFLWQAGGDFIRPDGKGKFRGALDEPAAAKTVAYFRQMRAQCATPIAMGQCGLPFADAGMVLQWHVLGMFVPSFFTGTLIRRFGVLRIMAVGVLLNLGCVAFALAGQDLPHFLGALLLLGRQFARQDRDEDDVVDAQDDLQERQRHQSNDPLSHDGTSRRARTIRSARNTGP